MRRALTVVGGGEHARVVAETAVAAGFEVLGYVAPEPAEAMTQVLGIPWLGTDGSLESGEALAVLGLGAVRVDDSRQRLVDRLGLPLAEWAIVVHPTAWVSPGAVLGAGTVVMAGALVQNRARIGAHCVINTGAIIEHDVDAGDFSIFGPGAVIGGGATIHAGALVGLGAQVRDHRVVGASALVAMGSVVVRDVAPGERVAGVPAKLMESGSE
jgi:acetyltransferase EpsM